MTFVRVRGYAGFQRVGAAGNALPRCRQTRHCVSVPVSPISAAGITHPTAAAVKPRASRAAATVSKKRPVGDACQGPQGDNLHSDV